MREFASRVALVMTRARALDHVQAVGRLPQREGMLLDDRDGNGIRIAARDFARSATQGSCISRARAIGEIGTENRLAGLEVEDGEDRFRGGVRFSPDRCSLEMPKPA